MRYLLILFGAALCLGLTACATDKYSYDPNSSGDDGDAVTFPQDMQPAQMEEYYPIPNVVNEKHSANEKNPPQQAAALSLEPPGSNLKA
jgi:uncharacterized lipoprotein